LRVGRIDGSKDKVPMVDDMVDDGTQAAAIEARQGGRDADEGRGVRSRAVPEAKVVEDVEIGLADHMVGLIDEDKRVPEVMLWMEAMVMSAVPEALLLPISISTCLSG
jgi:hypothetical protein